MAIHRKRIKLFPTPEGWFVDFCGDSETYKLFGSTILPTAYTARASSATVLTAIRQLNPGADVTLS